MQRQTRLWFSIAALASMFGALFAAFSTWDFISHLDRQVHPLHCSFIPGMLTESMTGDSGCRAVMNSAFSSFFRDAWWGGLPVALLALAVFAYMTALVFDMGLRGRLTDKGEAGYLFLASCLPAAMSAIYFLISTLEVKALCKQCAGIYLASAALFIATLMLYRQAEATFDTHGGSRRFAYFLEGVAFVAVAVVAYTAVLPRYEDKVLACGELKKPEDKTGVLVRLSDKGNPQSALIEVLDPLCPACKAFQGRFEGEHLGDGQPWSALLFPLDTECNWMLTQTLHPGACMVSRALLCAAGDAGAMLEFVYDNQEDFRITATKAPDDVRKRIVDKFPKVAGCIDQPETKKRLNDMLKYAAKNAMPIVTPQLYVGGRRLCDEDTDLGLNFAIARLIAKSKGASRGK